MPIYTIEAPNGKRLKIEADTPEAAMAGAQEYANGQGRRDSALSDARRRAASINGQARAIAQGASLGFSDELDATAAAGETALRNLLARTGMVKKAPYSAGDAYSAVMQAEREANKDFAGKHPAQNIALNIVGGLGTPGMGIAANYIGKSKNLVDALRRSAIVGGGAGAVAGAGSADGGFSNRAAGAATGGAMGAGLGVALPVAANGAIAALRPIARGGQNLADSVLTSVGRPGIASAQLRKATAADRKVALAIEKNILRGGSTPEDVMRLARANSQYPVFHHGGDSLSSMAEVLAQSPGPGESIIRSAAERSMGAGPARLKSELANRMGAKGDYFETLDTLKDARATKVKPLIEGAFDQPIDGDKYGQLFEPLMARVPTSAKKFAYDLAKIDGRNPDEWAMRLTDSYSGLPTGGYEFSPPPVPIDAADYLGVAGAMKPPGGRGDSLATFIAKRGGIKQDRGEVSAFGGDRWHRDLPYRNKLLNENGRTLEDHAQAALDAGYFPDKNASWSGADNMHPVTPEDILDGLRAEMSGKPLFAKQPDPAAVERFNRLSSLEDRLQQAGIDPRSVSREDAQRLLGNHEGADIGLDQSAYDVGPSMPQSEYLPTEQPTIETLHFLKKGLDKVLDQHRDPLTGRLDMSRTGVFELNDLRTKLAKGMRAVNDDYETAMATHGDDSDNIAALQIGRNVFSNKFDMNSERIADVWSKMSETAREQYQKGVAEAALNEVRTKGFGAIRRMMNDEFGARIRLAFRDQKEYGAFMNMLAQESKAQGVNSKVLYGPRTYARQAARADLEAQGADGVDMMADVVDSGFSPVRMTGKALKQIIKSIPQKDRSIIGDQNLNEIASKALVDPDEFERIMSLLKQGGRGPDALLKLIRSKGAPISSSAAQIGPMQRK